MNEKKLILASLTALLCLCFNPAYAYKGGDIILRAGLVNVDPDSNDSQSLQSVPGATVDVDDDSSLGATMTYMVNSNLGVGVLAAVPFKHDVIGSGILNGVGKVAETKHLPPTVTLQYHFDTKSKFHPFLGAGINYTHFFSDTTSGVINGTSIHFSDSWGLALEAGFDYDLGNNWSVGAQAWYIDIDSDAKLSGGPLGLNDEIEVNIDPWVFMISAGKRF